MNREDLPMGCSWDESMPFSSLNKAQAAARMCDRKLWCRIDGAPNHRIEVYPGGRSIAWPMDGLKRRHERMIPLEEGHRCKHAWETHTDSEPCAACVRLERYRQCLKCGQIREDDFR